MSNSFKFIFVFFLSLFISCITPSSAFAQGRSEGWGREGQTRSPRPTSSSDPRRTEACIAREAAIKTRANNLNRMATNMLETFDKITARVQDYYLRSGKSVTNYDSLVAAIATKRNAVQTALTAAQNDVASFTCETKNPRQYMTQFQTHMKTVKSSLKDYRTSIKNLIVAVRSAVGDEQSESRRSPRPWVSPKPSQTPNVNANPSSLRRYAQ